MIGPDRLDRVSAEAVVPEQLVGYVRSVAGSRPRLFDSCVGYVSGDSLVLIGYPLHDPLDEQSLNRAVDAVLATTTATTITVLAATRPTQAPAQTPTQTSTQTLAQTLAPTPSPTNAPDPTIAPSPSNAATTQPPSDAYLALPVPMSPPNQKLRNLLRRAGRDVVLDQGNSLGPDHTDLIRQYIRHRSLDPATSHIFQNIPAYLAACPGALVVSARLTADHRLAGFAVGDFTSQTTAMYMFAFRDSHLAPPGTADLLLHELLQESERRGQKRINLGLGINPAIRFFKQKWGATPFLPYMETRWERTRGGWKEKFRRMLGLKD